MKKTTEKKEAAPIRVGVVGLGRAGYGMQCQELLARPGKFTIVAGCDIAAPRRKRVAVDVPLAERLPVAVRVPVVPRVPVRRVRVSRPCHLPPSAA